MADHDVGTLIVPHHEAMSAAFRWLSRGAKLTKGFVIRRRGEVPLLLHFPMERDEARVDGVDTRSVLDYGYDEIFRASSDPAVAHARFFDRVLRASGAEGDVAFAGHAPLHVYTGVGRELERQGWKLSESGIDLVERARKRKESWEIDSIADVGRRTELVVNRVRDILRETTIDGDLVLRNNEPLRIGDLKEVVSLEIARFGMVEDHETILAQGHDAGVPHSRGDAQALVRPSLPIILDIFPADRVSGYFFDFTRTFCVGPVPARLRQLHDDVLEAFRRAASAIRPGTRASDYQALVCEMFESRGYVTIRNDPKTTAGYVHSLGHGVGLALHESPSFSLNPSNDDLIEEGDVLTVEPGLYFPEELMGVRIEDTFVITDEGARSLATIPYDLEP